MNAKFIELRVPPEADVIEPESELYIPAKILIKVDFPAPFAPSSAKTSPELIVSETSSNAWVAPNLLETCAMFTTGLFESAVETIATFLPLNNPVRKNHPVSDEPTLMAAVQCLNA